ncbi:hypothetical protein HMPREF9302_08880 [Prevotella amnii DNF00058]|uniref:Uncharacterized protein n=1 Tax=Prevotella amnii DNF00058 TaxID=1401066 RepID=A0A096D0I3_9BACT|nr:hypothetical protein HMPREF9302_08880 [Prevotella amnii DNF00058]
MVSLHKEKYLTLFILTIVIAYINKKRKRNKNKLSFRVKPIITYIICTFAIRVIISTTLKIALYTIMYLIK